MYAYYVVMCDNNQIPAKTTSAKLVIAEEEIRSLDHVQLFCQAAMDAKLVAGARYPVILSWHRLPDDDEGLYAVR